MISDDFKPLLVCPAVPHNGGIRFLLPSTQIDISKKFSSAVWEIIEMSNGQSDISYIFSRSKFPKEQIISIISDLVSLGIMTDSREIYKLFHNISSSPDTYYRELSRNDISDYTRSARKDIKAGEIIKFEKFDNTFLSNVIFNRRSCRNFSTERLTRDQICNACYYGYSIRKHSVPSGGALYPLKLYVLVETPQIGFNVGYYEYDPEREICVQYSDEVDIENLKYCFNEETLPFGSSVQIVIAADLERQTYKYSNKGYRLTLLEAGHVAQNIIMYCESNNIGSCEMGGVQEKPLRKELKIVDENVYPLVTIAIGKKSNQEQFDYAQFREEVESALVGTGKVVKSYAVHYFGDEVSWFAASSIYGAKKEYVAGATSNSRNFAITKAIIEAYERGCSGIRRVDLSATAHSINSLWLDPRHIRPLTNEQIRNTELISFDEDLTIDWTEGYYLHSNHRIFVPSDLVFYGDINIENRICFADSSGVAANTDYDRAVKSAILELVERDAIMRNWYEHKSPHKISKSALPLHVRKQIEYWKSKNRDLYVLDMGSVFAPTFQVVIVSANYPCFVSGAASSFDDPIGAITKALYEAEYSLLSTPAEQCSRALCPEDVTSPIEHGAYYASSQHVRYISWLWSSNIIEEEIPEAKLNFASVVELINPIIVNINNRGSYVKVLRAISEKCLPISFGYGLDYYSHPLLKGKTIDKIVRMHPHYFA